MAWNRSVRTRSRVVVCAPFVAVTSLLAAAGQASAIADAAAAQPASSLHLRVGTIATTPGTNVLVNGHGITPDRRHVVQFDGPMTPERSEIIAKSGITLGEYLPDNSWIVRLDKASAAALAVLPFVTWVGEFDAAWKIDPELAIRAYATPDRQSLAALGLCQVVVVVFNGEAPDEAHDALLKAGAQILESSLCGSQWMIDAVLPPAAARGLASIPSIQFIEDAPEGSLRNDSNRWIVQSNVSGQTPIWDRGIQGQGQVGGLIDDTPYEGHCMFDDTPAPGTPGHRKFIGWRNATGPGFHGTHTAGTMAGDRSPFGAYTLHDGLAFAAKISFSGLDAVVSSPSTLQPRLENQHADGARVHSNSWGDDGTTAYTTWCRQIDLFTWANEESVVAFAVSNLSSLKTPENSINVLAVGASNDAPNQGTISSGGQGPTIDGRRKPEIYAPGSGTVSATTSGQCSTASASGTSMACPAISGAGLLVRQYFTDGFYPSGAAVLNDSLVPSGALIRAVMLNGTVDMSGVSGYPTNREGWGRLILDNGLYFPGDARGLHVTDIRNAQGLTTGQQVEQQIICNSPGQPLRVTLVWTGPAATVGASNPVINNLDLEVVGPSSSVYRGNAFTSGQSSVGGVADLKNNVEQFLLNTPDAGTYTILVKGTTVNQGPQGYALVITGDVTDPCGAPAFIDQPRSVNIDEGLAAIFSVDASGDDLAYQWRLAGSPLLDDVRISGSSTATLTIDPVTTDDAGLYDVIVSNACDDVESDPAELTVNIVNTCPADLDGIEGLGVPDIFQFLALWFAGDALADWDEQDGIGVPDIFAYLSDWFAGC